MCIEWHIENDFMYLQDSVHKYRVCTWKFSLKVRLHHLFLHIRFQLYLSTCLNDKLKHISNSLPLFGPIKLTCLTICFDPEYISKISRCIFNTTFYLLDSKRPSWPWSYGNWIYSCLCNQYLSPLILWGRISIRARCLTLCDKVCQLLPTVQWYSGFRH
jgi:hypothetical protein